MATIQRIFSCPRCDADIVAIETTTTCPSCGLPLGRQPTAPYSPPYTLTEQHTKLQDQKLYVETLLNLPIEKANNIMNDALSLIEVVAGKNNAAPDIRLLVELAKQIGEIANAYDAFLKAKGRHVPSFFITPPPSPGVENELQKTGDRKEAPPGAEDHVGTRMGALSRS